MLDEVTLVGLFYFCAQFENLNLGREFHRFIEGNGLNLTVILLMRSRTCT